MWTGDEDRTRNRPFYSLRRITIESQWLKLTEQRKHNVMYLSSVKIQLRLPACQATAFGHFQERKRGKELKVEGAWPPFRNS
jgi:hypothetical protein